MAERPWLGAIREVVYAVPDLDLVEAAYHDWLDYEVLGRGAVSNPAAANWSCPAAAGRSFVSLGPASGERCTLTFVESPHAAGWRALTTWGWNATEFVVQDVDALAEKLAAADSPFRIIGPPKSLTRYPMIRAMQCAGPAGEFIYLTQVGDGSGLDLAQAQSFVGKVFIVVAAGPDLPAMFRPYDRFANPQDPGAATPVWVISWANDLPADTPHPHGLIPLSEGTALELDGYPDVTGPRTRPPGDLPPGMALVAFDCPQIGHGDHIIEGAAGELIQLMGATDPRHEMEQAHAHSA
jgi:hypothetical protein